MPLTRWGRTAGQNEFWVRIDVGEAGEEWPAPRPLVGWFQGECYLFLAACVPIYAGLPGRNGIASRILSANVTKSANLLSLLDTLFARLSEGAILLFRYSAECSEPTVFLKRLYI